MTAYNTNSFLSAGDKTQYLKNWITNSPNTFAGVAGNKYQVGNTFAPITPVSFVNGLSTDEPTEQAIIEYFFRNMRGPYLEFFIKAHIASANSTTGSLTAKSIRSLYQHNNAEGKEIRKLFVMAIVEAKNNNYFGSFFDAGGADQGTITRSYIPGNNALLSNFKSLKDKIDAVIQSSITASGAGTGGLTGAAGLAALEARNATSASAVAAPLIRGSNVSEETFQEEDLRNYLQCVLLRDFVNSIAIRQDAFATQSSNPSNMFQPLRNPDPTALFAIPGYETMMNAKEYARSPYKGRILPLSMANPEEFLNKCNFPSNMKHVFEQKAPVTESSFDISFFHIKPILDTKGKHISTTKEVSLNLNPNTSDITLGSVKIDFDGTNPSTARRDVKVVVNLKLKNMSVLQNNIATADKEEYFELFKLITIPYGVQAGSTVSGGLIRNQYSPDYNRIRMKVASKIKVDFSKNTRKPVKSISPSKQNFITDKVFDLAIESHDLKYSEVANSTELTITYRGYFESLLSHPFMDSLATSTTMTARFASDEALIKASKNCSTETVTEIMRINRLSDAEEAKTGAWGKFINNIGNNTAMQWVPYTCSALNLRAFAFTDSLEFLRGPRDLCTFDLSIYDRNVGTTLANLTKIQNDATDQKIKVDSGTFGWGGSDPLNDATEIKGSFTTLGAIMEVALEGLYENDAATEMREQFKHLNLKFLIAPISIRNPLDSSRTLYFNPLELPIDILFFNQWFQATIINKGLTYYPILTMLRDLIERLVNNLLFEVCFPSSLPDETPPILRTGFFQDNSGVPMYSSNRYYYDIDYHIDANNKTSLFTYDTNSTNETTNYCVIYMQNKGNFIRNSAKSNLFNSPYVPYLKHGTKFVNLKNENLGTMSDVSFAKVSTPGLKEARFFSGPTGGLNVLSNVYNLTFSFKNNMSNMLLYPGQIIRFTLADFDDYNNDWRQKNALSAIMGFGGYYTIKKVSYSLNNSSGTSYTITYSAIWSGNGGGLNFRRAPDSSLIIENKASCEAQFDAAVTRYTTAGGDQELDREFRITNVATQSGQRYFLSGTSTDEARAEVAEMRINNALDAWISSAMYGGGPLHSNFIINQAYANSGVTVKTINISSDRKTVGVLVTDDTTGISAEYALQSDGSTITKILRR